MGIKEDIEDAIDAHGAWKAKFRDFLSGKAAIDISAIGGTCACKLGKWLEADGHRLLAQKDHEEACRLHAEFHRVCAEIIRKIKSKDFAAAHQSLATDGPFDQASLALTEYLLKATLHAPPKPAAIQDDSAKPPAKNT